MIQVRVNSGRVAEQIWLPLAGVATDEAVKVIEAHSDWPLVERPGLARLERRRVVILAKPGRGVPVVLQNLSDRGLVSRDDAVVARESARLFGNYPEASRVMVTARDQRRSRWRTKGRGMEVC